MIKIRKTSVMDIDTFMKFSFDTDKEDLLKLMQNSNNILLTAKEGKEIVGFTFTLYDPNSRDSCTYAFTVKEEKNGQDIIKKLLTQTLIQLKTLDSNNMFRRIQVSNETVKSFFERYSLQISELLNSLPK